VRFGAGQRFQGLCISKILGSAGRTLVADEVGNRRDAHRDALDFDGGCARRRLLESQAGRSGDDVDPAWRDSDLENGTCLLKISLGEIVKRRAETADGAEHGLGVTG